MARSILGLMAALLVVAGGYNFLTLITESAHLHGDASSGHVIDGHYFVGNHGRYTEVPQEAWEASRFHSRSVFVTHPLMMVSLGYLLLTFVLPAMLGSRAPNSDERVESIRQSGGRLVSARCGGRFGWINYSSPMLRTDVYPGGILVRPFLAASRAVLAAEIHSIAPASRALSRGIEISHLGADLESPFILWTPETGPLATAIQGLKGGKPVT